MIKVKTYSEFINETYDDRFTKEENKVMSWLESSNVKISGFSYSKYTIHKDSTIDVTCNVEIKTKYEKLPYRFGKVDGFFDIGEIGLATLEGCPSYIGGSFRCQNNKLTSLEGCPEYIGGNFFCFNNRLTSLVFASKEPDSCGGNPCEYIYYELGFTPEAHVKALLTLDPDWKGTLEKLKVQFPERYAEITQDRKHRLELGMEDEELTTAYNNSKSREGDFY